MDILRVKTSWNPKKSWLEFTSIDKFLDEFIVDLGTEISRAPFLESAEAFLVSLGLRS